MARRSANFSFDQRGCAPLLSHVLGLLETGGMDKDIATLDLTGTRAVSHEDRRCIQKIVGAFNQVRAISLYGCCLQDVAFLAQLLCCKFVACQRVDLLGTRFLGNIDVPPPRTS